MSADDDENCACEVRGALGDDLGGDAADAGAGEANRAGSTRREIEDTAANEGAAVVDGDDHARAAMGDAELGAERQRTVRRGHGVLVEALARGRPAAGLIAVKGGHAGEAVPPARRWRHGRVGVEPGVRAVAGVRSMMTVMIPVMPGFGGSFGDSSTEEESCGNESDRRTWSGRSAQHLQRQHLVVPKLVLPHMWQVEPPSVCEQDRVSILNEA